MPHSKNNAFTAGVAQTLADIILGRPPARLSLQDIADISGYSVHYIKYMFKDHIGMSPGRFIKDVYLEHAARELMNTQDKIMVIALNAGYGSQQTFSRAFRHKYQVTPTTFRALPADDAALLLKAHTVLYPPRMAEHDSVE